MRILRKSKYPTLVDDALVRLQSRGIFKLPFDFQGRSYYRAIQGEGAEDHTFVVEHEGNVIGVVECDGVSGVLGRFGFPLEILLESALPYEVRCTAVIDICAELQRLARELDLKSIHLRSAESADPDGVILGYLFRHGAQPRLEMRASADLSLSEEILFADMRKGHRQQVRWGQSNLSWSYVDSANPSLDSFNSYRAFHAEIAGRVTRNADSWTTMFEIIASGHGDLVLGHYDGRLVSGTLVLDGCGTAYYASGVYQRQLFDKPLGHAAVFAAILRAKKRGCREFDVGELPWTAATSVSDKERAIGFFKQGFTSRTDTSVVLTWMRR